MRTVPRSPLWKERKRSKTTEDREESNTVVLTLDTKVVIHRKKGSRESQNLARERIWKENFMVSNLRPGRDLGRIRVVL